MSTQLPQFSCKICNILLMAVILLHTTNHIVAGGFSPDSETSTDSPVGTAPTAQTQATGNSSYASGSEDYTFKCGDLKNRDQRKLCMNTTGLREILNKTETRARTECETQFRKHKWQCYGFTMFNRANITKKACKESSFVYSLISGMLTHTIAEACEKREINCTLGNIKTENQTIISESNHIMFGMSLAQRFLDVKEYNRKSLNDRQRLNLHNNKLGRQVVYDNVQHICSCHGMSAACTLQFCKKKLPTISEISALLKKSYDRAQRVRSSHNGHHFLPYDKSAADDTDLISSKDMIFFDKSPDFCFRDTSIGSSGVTGQSCDIHGKTGELESCTDNCCGRGVTVATVIKEDQCCRFVWCCHVKCDKCETKEQTYQCK